MIAIGRAVSHLVRSGIMATGGVLVAYQELPEPLQDVAPTVAGYVLMVLGGLAFWWVRQSQAAATAERTALLQQWQRERDEIRAELVDVTAERDSARYELARCRIGHPRPQGDLTSG